MLTKVVRMATVDIKSRSENPFFFDKGICYAYGCNPLCQNFRRLYSRLRILKYSKSQTPLNESRLALGLQNQYRRRILC